jgi:hypothetical protein
MSSFREAALKAIGKAAERLRFRKTPNTIGCYWDNRHVILFKRREPWGSGSAWGAHTRVRLRNGEWRQTIVRFFEKAKPIPGATGAWKCEFEQYRSEKAVGGRDRTTIKRFLRVKWGLGGKSNSTNANS